MRFLILAAVAGAVAIPTAASAQHYGGRGYGQNYGGYGQGYNGYGRGGYGYNNREVRREQRECARELRRADSRREYRRELRECRREINQARYGYRDNYRDDDYYGRDRRRWRNRW
jgi:hypothetical protein